MAVLLLSVDAEYSPKNDSYKATAKRIYETKKVDWPNVFLEKGWTDAARIFNTPGYGNILIDGKGIVRGVNAHDKELETLVSALIKENGDSNGKPK